jgi:hypothetical protein
MRYAVAALLLLGFIASVACGDDDDTPDAAASPTRAGAAATSAATPTSSANTPVNAATPSATEVPPTGDESEVAGIVGAVDQGSNTIEITHLSGAAVTKVRVTSGTELRRARGGNITLAQIRPSDRIIAEGDVEGDVMTAREVTVQDVVPGAQPGG